MFKFLFLFYHLILVCDGKLLENLEFHGMPKGSSMEYQYIN